MTYDQWKTRSDLDDWQDWEQQTAEICYCGHSGECHDGPVCTVVGCACISFDCEYEE